MKHGSFLADHSELSAASQGGQGDGNGNRKWRILPLPSKFPSPFGGSRLSGWCESSSGETFASNRSSKSGQSNAPAMTERGSADRRSSGGGVVGKVGRGAVNIARGSVDLVGRRCSLGMGKA